MYKPREYININNVEPERIYNPIEYINIKNI